MVPWSSIRRKIPWYKRLHWWLLDWEETIERRIVAWILRLYINRQYLTRCDKYYSGCPNCNLWDTLDVLELESYRNIQRTGVK